MTIDDLLRELERIKANYYWVCWTGDGLVSIRGIPSKQISYNPNFCPITALARELLQKNYSPKFCYLAALDLGIDFGLAYDLVLACNTYERPELRDRIESVLFKGHQ